MNKAILWDLDGTLLDTLNDITNAVNACMAHFGYEKKTMEQVKEYTGNGASVLLHRCVGDPHNFEEIHSWFRAYFAQHSNDTSRPYDGIPELAERLQKRGWKMGIVSNKPDGATKPLWKYHFPSFDLAMGEGPGIPRKPAPNMVWEALRQLDVQPENAVYVGDSEVDVATAKAAGLPCLSVTWGLRSEQELIEAGASILCRTPGDMERALEELDNGK